MNHESTGLVRGLGPWASASIVVGTMIGTGIFIVPADIARIAGSVRMVLGIWIVGGLLSLFGALCYAELGAAIPEAGGEYAYMNRGYGPAWGFLFGWMHSMLGRPTSIATIAAGLMRFCSFLVPAIGGAVISLPLAGHIFTLTWAQILAVVAIAAVTFVNYLGVRLGGRVQVALTTVKIAAVIVVIIVGFLAHRAGAIPAGISLIAQHPGNLTVAGLLAALVGALWTYDGWSDINLVGSEVFNPGENIPRALVGGVAAVALLYMLLTLACFHVLPFAAVAASPHVASDVLTRVLGRGAASWLTLGMIVCALGTLNSSILSGARVDYAMARDRRFFHIAAGIHPRYRTPSRALLFQACLAAILALTGTFEDLYSLFIFAAWVFYGLAAAAVISFRLREPNLQRPYRAWGYPVTPAIFVLAAIALTVNLWMARPIRSTIGLMLILSGLFFYRHWRRESKTAGA